jgi:hypothetical protein
MHKCDDDDFTDVYGIIPCDFPDSQHYLFRVDNGVYGFRIVSLKYNDGLVYWINIINPIAIYSTLLQPGIELSYITILVYGLMFIISLVSALTFKTEPVWSSQ